MFMFFERPYYKLCVQRPGLLHWVGWIDTCSRYYDLVEWCSRKVFGIFAGVIGYARVGGINKMHANLFNYFLPLRAEYACVGYQ